MTLRAILIGASEVALAMGPLLVIQSFTGNGAWLSVAAIVLAAVGLSISTSLFLSGRTLLMLSPTLYRASELVLLVVGIRVATWQIFDRWPDFGSISDLLEDPFRLFDLPYVAALVISVFAWERSAAIMRLFVSIRSDQTRAEMGGTATGDPAGEFRHRVQPDQVYSRIWLFGAALLALCAALASFDLAKLFASESLVAADRLPVAPAMIAILFTYFIAGLLLFSDARLAEMKEQWRVAGATLQAQVSRHWHASSVLLLLAAAVIAAILPGGLVVPLGGVADAMWSACLLVVQIMLLPVLAFIAAIQKLVGPGEAPPAVGDDAAPAPNVLPPLAPADSAPAGEASMVFGSILWIGLLLVVLLCLVHFLRHRRRFGDGHPAGFWRTFATWLATLWRRLVGPATQRRHPGGATVEIHDADAMVPHRAARSRRAALHTPHGRIWQAYLALVEWAADHGAARDPSMTPTEFADRLRNRWPAADPDTSVVTRLFEKARYSGLDVAADEAGMTEAALKRIRAYGTSASLGEKL